MNDAEFKARTAMRAVIAYLDPTENKHTARALSSADTIIGDLVAALTGWRPIETAPKDGSRILAWHPEWSAPLAVQFYDDTWGIDYTLPRLLNQPTHWMRLTAAPQAQVALTAGNAT